jgi:hypothetical protein
VGESGGSNLSDFYKSKQSEEKWNMIDSSFITTFTDTWASISAFIMLAEIE